MPRALFSGLVLWMSGMFILGCSTPRSSSSSSAPGETEFRRYVEDRPRVDTEVEGNAGYLMGTPPPEALEGIQDTRRFYVFEFTKEAESGEEIITYDEQASESFEQDFESEFQKREARRLKRRESNNYRELSFDDMDLDETIEEASTSFTEYTVEKDDTLQKISKKFYDSYRKWPQIYEANKDVIGDPNTIKPGIVLRIPTD